MFLTVALNATLQVSYEVPEISWGAANHVRQLSCRADGGGLAVARVLVGLGEDVVASGFAGGGAARAIEADLARSGVTTALTGIGRESRRVVELLDEARAQITRLAEPAPFITTEELGRFAADYRKLLTGMDAVVLSGGLPAGLPGDVYASLTSYAVEAGVPAIVHASGPALWHSLGRHPALVLAASSTRAPGATARPGVLVTRGAAAAAVISGPGLSAAAGHRGYWRATLHGYPRLVLSAEAVVAGLVPAVAQDWSWPDTLRHAVALGAAADPRGEVDLDAYEMFSSEVSVTAGG